MIRAPRPGLATASIEVLANTDTWFTWHLDDAGQPGRHAKPSPAPRERVASAASRVRVAPRDQSLLLRLPQCRGLFAALSGRTAPRRPSPASLPRGTLSRSAGEGQ